MENKPLDQFTKRMYMVVAWGSLAVIVAVILYGVVASLVKTGTGLAIGIELVNVEWPLPYFAKPVSYFSIACVSLFYSGLRLGEERIAKWPRQFLSFLQLFGFVVAFASAYEVLYNFMLWGSFLSSQLVTSSVATLVNINSVSSPGPVPWNLVFATKIFLSIFVISAYVTYFLRRIHRPSGARDAV